MVEILENRHRKEKEAVNLSVCLPTHYFEVAQPTKITRTLLLLARPPRLTQKIVFISVFAVGLGQYMQLFLLINPFSHS